MCFGSKSKLKKNAPPARVPVQHPQGFNSWLESNPYNQSPRAPKRKHRGGHGPYYGGGGDAGGYSGGDGGGGGGDGGGGGGGGDGGGCQRNLGSLPGHKLISYFEFATREIAHQIRPRLLELLRYRFALLLASSIELPSRISTPCIFHAARPNTMPKHKSRSSGGRRAKKTQEAAGRKIALTSTSSHRVGSGSSTNDAGTASYPTDSPSSKSTQQTYASSTFAEDVATILSETTLGPTDIPSATAAAAMKPTPIDLRSLTIFLRYVLYMADPRLGGTCLVESSLVDETCWQSETLRPVLATVKDKDMAKEFYAFLRYNIKHTDVNPIAFGHPDNSGPSKEKIDNLDRGTLEYIYNVSRSSERSGDAIAVFQEYFKGLPSNQTLSIQLGDDEPFAVEASDARVLEVKLFQTKNLIITTTLHDEGDTMSVLDYGVGHIEGVSHYLLMFQIPGVAKDITKPGNNMAVVDMTSMQFGEVGRGTRNELFIMDTFYNWTTKISGYTECIEKVGITKTIPHTADVIRITNWVVGTARESMGRGYDWCRYCGMREGDMIKLYLCELCNDEKAQYCKWHVNDEYHQHKVEGAKPGVDKGKGKA